MAQLSFDTAGRVTLPENLCHMFGLTDQAVIVGLGDRFQIWRPDVFHAERLSHRQSAREGLAALRAQQRLARAGGAA